MNKKYLILLALETYKKSNIWTAKLKITPREIYSQKQQEYRLGFILSVLYFES